jgi:uncharacterized protein (DUF305 family)
MKKLFLTSLAIGAAVALSACGSDENTEAETAATDEAAVDPNNPFADLETQMGERMMAAVGIDAGDTWVRKMIEHHQGAIDMSRLMLAQNSSQHTAEMAQDTIDKQTREIAELRKLVKEGSPDPQSAEPFRPNMQRAMTSATGADVEETFMRKMLAHHEGGVALSEVALENGASGAVRSQAMKTRDDQQKEAEMVEAMLRGEPMLEAENTQAAAPAAAAPAARSTSAPARPSAAASPRPRPQETPAPAEPADEHAGHDMSGQ